VGKIHIDDELIRHLADLLDETGLSEIEVGVGRDRLRVSRAATVSVPAQMTANVANKGGTNTIEPEDGVQNRPSEEDSENEKRAVKSPMVGTIYVAPEPDAKPFVSEGDNVDQGDTLFIIEAMKTMNPVTSPRAGRVQKILAEDGNPVEYDEILALID
jgi:acetyl-CoA carboxylase biotin carboxyl carrier protein